jgi:two-component system, NtrC family, nitrogen regulation sensor histidine kinase GlnL
MSAVMPLKNNENNPILDNLSTGVLVVNREYKLVYMNPAAEELLGTSLRMAGQIRLNEIMIDGGPTTFLDCLQTQQPAAQSSYTYREITLHPPNAPEHIVNCTITPMFEGDKLLVEISSVDRILKIAQEEHLVSQHLIARQIARGLAHEINNPLGGLRGAAQLLERELPEAAREYTRIIIAEADRLQNLTKRMLGPSSLPRKAELNLYEVLDHVVKLLYAESKSRLRIRYDIDPSLPPLIADRDQLVQAILNIVRNAWQAIDPETGGILLRTRITRNMTIGQAFHKLLLRLDVIDNGPGIPPDRLKQIFYPMVTSRSEGTGLGLTIAQSLISLHGGLIECSSKPGETVFSILLPFNHTSERLHVKAG